MPTISVIMGIYNEKEAGIRKSVDSIIHQTFEDWEFIIVVDNPENKEAIDLIKKYATADIRIKLVVHDKNKGLAAGLNQGVRMSRGEYVARQDTEDVSLPERLKDQLDYLLRHPDVHALGTAVKYLDSEERLIMLRKYKPVVGNEIKRNSPVAHPTLLMRKKAFIQYGFYQEDVFCEDYDLWIKWFLQGAVFHNLQDSYYNYYQDNQYKIKKAKPQLRDTIQCKYRHRDELGFTCVDNLYLFGQRLLLLLPSSLIVSLFYKTHRNQYS